MMRPPAPIRGAAARAPRNVPVRLVSMTSRQRVGGEAGDVQVLARHPRVGDPHVDAAEPLGHPLGDGLVEQVVPHVAGADQVVARELARHPVEGGLGPGDQGEPRARGVEGAGQHAAEAAPGAGDHHAPPGQAELAGGGGRGRGGSLVFHGR